MKIPLNLLSFCLHTGWKGFVIGLANIIPGVSGGTMALVLGIYERMIQALNNIGPQSAKVILSNLAKGPKGFEAVKAELKRIDFWFLTIICVGAAVAIVATSGLIDYLLNSFRGPTYAFFCGLIFVSIVVPFRMMKGKVGALAIVTLLIGIAVAAALGSKMVGKEAEMVGKARQKAVLKGLLPESVLTLDPASEADDVALQTRIEGAADAMKLNHDPAHLGYLMLSGALGMSAMILPGVSGSFLLLVLGVYFEIIAAIKQFDLWVIGSVGIGCCLGLLAFTRLLNWLLKKWHDPTMTFLAGLMVGSFYGLWPFRNHQIVASEKIYTTFRGAASTGELAFTLLAFVVGAAIVATFLVYEIKKPRPADESSEAADACA